MNKEKLTSIERVAIGIVLDFVERWNKQDKDIAVAEAQMVLNKFLEE